MLLEKFIVIAFTFMSTVGFTHIKFSHVLNNSIYNSVHFILFSKCLLPRYENIKVLYTVPVSCDPLEFAYLFCSFFCSIS